MATTPIWDVVLLSCIFQGLILLAVSGQPTSVTTPPGTAQVATCLPNGNATAALQPLTTPMQLGSGTGVTLNVLSMPRVGYLFEASNVTVSPYSSTPGRTRGSIFIPEDGVDPGAYAPYARAVALQGYLAVVVKDRTVDAVVAAMEIRSDVEFWVLGGHGKGGTLAATLASLWAPRVKGLVLLASALPASLDLSSLNLIVTHAYGSADVIVLPERVRSDAARLPADAWLVPFDLGHYDFAYGQCAGNSPDGTGGSGTSGSGTGGSGTGGSGTGGSGTGGSGMGGSGTGGNGMGGSGMGGSVRSAADGKKITQLYTLPLGLAQWFEATPRALSYSNNSLLTPGLDISKPYPEKSTGTVTFQSVPIPDTLPQRMWFVFSPPARTTKGGLIYYQGAAVDSRAYFPLAFEIAARGWLVVIVQQTARISPLFSNDATAVLDSNHTAFAHVSKSHWAIGGHSAGGLGASQFAFAHPTECLRW